MTVRSHMMIFSTIKGIPLTKQTQYIRDMLTLFNMQEDLDCKISHLSGGTKRKLKFITALIGKSKYLLLDEPTIGVHRSDEDTLCNLLSIFN